MNAKRKKMLRLQRLLALEQSRLDALSVQLAELESRRANQSRQLANLKTQIDTASAVQCGRSIASHSQTMIWIDYLQSLASELIAQLHDITLQYNELVGRAIQKKIEIRGWQSLIDRLNAEAAGELLKLESLIADDRYLTDRLAR